MLESQYQARLINTLKEVFPGCIVLKNDPNYIQGFPDLLVLVGDRWVALEVKRAVGAPVRPNQEYYINRLGKMGIATFIAPETEEQVLNEIQQALNPGW